MTDTAQKRGAALNMGPTTVLPMPDGTIDASDRAQLAGAYVAEVDPPAEQPIYPPRSRTIFAGWNR